MKKLTVKGLACFYHRRRHIAILIALSGLMYLLFMLSIERHKYERIDDRELVGFSDYEEKKDEKFLFCFILTAPKYIDSRALTIERTWARECDKHFFISGIPDNMKNETAIANSNEIIESFKKVPILQPKNFQNEIYGRLTDKVYMTIRDVHKRYGDYEWYLKSDDDTFIFVDNLKKFLKTKNSSDPLPYGYNFRVIVDGGYHSGGGGYVMPNKAFNNLGKKLDENLDNCKNTGTEDVDVAKCLRLMNVSVGSSLDHLGRERFHLLDVDAHLKGYFPDWLLQYAKNNVSSGPECCSDETVSFHYMNSDKIEKLYNLWTKYKAEPPASRNFTKMLYESL